MQAAEWKSKEPRRIELNCRGGCQRWLDQTANLSTCTQAIRSSGNSCVSQRGGEIFDSLRKREYYFSFKALNKFISYFSAFSEEWKNNLPLLVLIYCSGRFDSIKVIKFLASTMKITKWNSVFLVFMIIRHAAKLCRSINRLPPSSQLNFWFGFLCSIPNESKTIELFVGSNRKWNHLVLKQLAHSRKNRREEEAEVSNYANFSSLSSSLPLFGIFFSFSLVYLSKPWDISLQGK